MARELRAREGYYASLPEAEIVFFHGGVDYVVKMITDLASFLPAPVAVDPLLIHWFSGAAGVAQARAAAEHPEFAGLCGGAQPATPERHDAHHAALASSRRRAGGGGGVSGCPSSAASASARRRHAHAAAGATAGGGGGGKDWRALTSRPVLDACLDVLPTFGLGFPSGDDGQTERVAARRA